MPDGKHQGPEIRVPNKERGNVSGKCRSGREVRSEIVTVAMRGPPA